LCEDIAKGELVILRHWNRTILVTVGLVGLQLWVDRAFAAPLFPNPIFNVGDTPIAMVVGDFNGDGKPDVAVANRLSNDISVLLGLGEGSFGPETRYPVMGPPQAIAAGDFNGDGRMDLAVAGYSGGVAVLLSVGGGGFASSISYPTTTHGFLASIAVGDFNNDGVEDLAVTGGDTAVVCILLGLGGGVFPAQPGIGKPVGSQPTSVAVGDFNGDGYEDLAVTNALSSSVSVLLGLGRGAFAPQVSYFAGNGAFDVSIGDFNNDGRQDLAVADGASFGVFILLGAGNGTFGSRPIVGGAGGPTQVLIWDFNSDGNQDLAMNGGNGLVISLGLGDGTFAPRKVFLDGYLAALFAMGDFNADGKQDFVATATGPLPHTGDLWMIRGNGDGSFGLGNSYPLSDATSLAVGDFNSDGNADLAISQSNFDTGSSGVPIVTGLGNGSLAPSQHLEVGMDPASVAVGDFNKDGIQDLAVANSGSNDLSILIGAGGGAFGPDSRTPAGTTPRSAVVADFNNDGFQDIAVIHFGVGDVSILIGRGDGTFDPGGSAFADGIYAGIGVGDFNKDGIDDIVVTEINSNDVAVALGLGGGIFSQPNRFNVGYGPVPVAIGDFNADGVPDLAVGNVYSNDVSVLLGLGGGAFAAQDRILVGKDPLHLVTGDFNLDGMTDIATLDAFSQDISILLGTAGGSFAAPSRFRVMPFAGVLAIADFNHDGLEDLVVDGSSGFSVLLNAGPSSTPQSPRAVIAAPSSVECSAYGVGSVTLDGSGSRDSTDGSGLVSYQWNRLLESGASIFLGSGPIVTVTLPLGSNRVQLEVTSASRRSGSTTADVLVIDTCPPILALTLSPTTLWPPDHRMVPVQAQWQASDICDPTPGVILVSVVSNPPDLGAGSGETTADIQDASLGTSDSAVLLRAERPGDGSGRIYTLTYQATDASGNQAMASGVVTVPHDRRTLSGTGATTRHRNQNRRRIPTKSKPDPQR